MLWVLYSSPSKDIKKLCIYDCQYSNMINLFHYFLIKVSLDVFSDIFKAASCVLAAVLIGKEDVHMAVIAKGER